MLLNEAYGLNLSVYMRRLEQVGVDHYSWYRISRINTKAANTVHFWVLGGVIWKVYFYD